MWNNSDGKLAGKWKNSYTTIEAKKISYKYVGWRKRDYSGPSHLEGVCKEERFYTDGPLP